jgi:membrane protein
MVKRLRQATERLEDLGERSLSIAGKAPGFAHGMAAVLRDQRHGGGLLAGALAFRLFGAMLPFALLVAVALGYARTVDRSSPEKAGHAIGISTALLQSVAESSRLSSGTRWTVVAFGSLALVWAAMSAARAIRAAHSLAWDGRVVRLKRPLPAGLVLIAAVAAVAAVWGVVGRSRAELDGLPGLVAAFAAVIPFFGIWLGMAWLLPHGDAPLRALIPGALLVAFGLEVIQLGTVLFVAGRVEHASATYGSFGVAFTALLWLYFVSRVIVASAMLNAAMWERRRDSTGGPARPRRMTRAG